MGIKANTVFKVSVSPTVLLLDAQDFLKRCGRHLLILFDMSKVYNALG